MHARTVIHQLLARAFVDIAAEARVGNHPSWSRLASLFATIPPDLERVASGIGSYDEVLGSLRERAQAYGVVQWIDGSAQDESRWGRTDSRTVVHHLVYRALIELCMEAHEAQEPSIFRLTDLLHNTPVRLELALDGKWTYDEILAGLRERARQNGSADWLDQAPRDATAVVAR